jgi:hypothetical protein
MWKGFQTEPVQEKGVLQSTDGSHLCYTVSVVYFIEP